jgi:MoaA/NifB/PqqE/SkfB family radical SAM enzyme
MRIRAVYRQTQVWWYGGEMDELDRIAARIQERDAGGERGPWTLELYPTLRCNLSCAFCDTTDRHRPAVGELPIARQLAIVDEAAALGVRRVCILGGGEPLLSPAALPLFRRVKEHGLDGFLTTNGTRCDDAVARLLVDVGWDEVHVSVDGATAETHDALRGKAGAFRRTVTALCHLRRLRDAAGRDRPRLALHTVVTNRNVGELAGIVRLAAAVGAFRVDFDALVAYRPEQQALALSPRDEAALPAAVEDGLAEADRLGIVTTLARFRAVDTVRRGARLPTAGEGTGLAAAPCLKAWHHLVVQADGRTSPCCVLAGEGESVAEVSLGSVWEHGATLAGIRAGMLAGRPTGRCAECSENILAHERAIRGRLAASPPVAGASAVAAPLPVGPGAA